MKFSLNKSLPLLLVLLTVSLLLGWLELTPPGLMGKLDAIGFAVCHRIPERSLNLADRPLPLCARCSGMYLGAWIGFIYLAFRGKKGGLPAKSASIIFAVFAAIFVMDGVNSYFTFFNPNPILYAPQNWLRLMTGSGLGLAIASYFIPIINQTLWIGFTFSRSLPSWKPVICLIAAAVLVNLALLTGNPLLVYPLSILSGLTVMVVLSLAYTLVWVLVTHRENSFVNFKEVRFHVLAGFCTALLQIILIDAARFSLTGNWGGF